MASRWRIRSTGKVVHILDVQTGEEVGQFPSGNSPHENVYSDDGERLYHASIGHVFLPLDRDPIKLKGERVFQVVDAHTLETQKIDMKEAGRAGYPDGPAVRPMAHTPDERWFTSSSLSFMVLSNMTCRTIVLPVWQRCPIWCRHAH